MTTVESFCPACGSSCWRAVYRGDIRLGRFPTVIDGLVEICEACGLRKLKSEPLDYESPAYRALVDEDPSIEGFHRLHDPEIETRAGFVGLASLRDMVVADIGCGGGSFLDAARGLAKTTIAIEPAQQFRLPLRNKGHSTYAFAADAAAEWKGKVDVATIFAVIEHIEDPLLFLHDVVTLLRPGGRVIISTPNANDWLMDFLPETFGPFFYRYVHRWYFDAKSLLALLGRAGFGEAETTFHQSYDLSNALLWARDGLPTGNGKFKLLEQLDPPYRRLLNDSGRSDTLIGYATKT